MHPQGRHTSTHARYSCSCLAAEEHVWDCLPSDIKRVRDSQAPQAARGELLAMISWHRHTCLQAPSVEHVILKTQVCDCHACKPYMLCFILTLLRQLWCVGYQTAQSTHPKARIQDHFPRTQSVEEHKRCKLQHKSGTGGQHEPWQL